LNRNKNIKNKRDKNGLPPKENLFRRITKRAMIIKRGQNGNDIEYIHEAKKNLICKY
jgi:hypothetical protein